MYLPRRPIESDRRAGEAVDQRLARRAAHRALTADLDAFDAAADHERDHPAPNRLDLGQLGHAYSSAARASYASEAACCSACFFDFPSPAPSAVPATSTVALNVLE